jgi:dTMP kinase
LFRGDARFIVFEGIDGSGKSTQARLLADRLARSFPVLFTAEPSDGPVGRRIRSLTERPEPLEEARLFTEDRRHHVEHVIVPALAAGKVVLCDRYVYSSAAYQGARGIPVRDILSWHAAFAVGPDVTVLLELEVASALERIASGRDRTSLFEDREYLENVAAIYRGMDDPLIVRVDALGGTNAVHEKIVAALAQMECFEGYL